MYTQRHFSFEFSTLQGHARSLSYISRTIDLIHRVLNRRTKLEIKTRFPSEYSKWRDLLEIQKAGFTPDYQTLESC